MNNYLSQQPTPLRPNERGQIAILMVMVMPAIFLFFALALDAGVWFLDHRLAQNQVDAATLAAIQHLPAADMEQGHIDAINDVDRWITKNGGDPADLCEGSPQFFDLHPSTPDDRYDAVRVCIRRKSQSIFAGLADLDFIYISAAATARVGPASPIAEVMPWALVPSDLTCDVENVLCKTDYGDGNGMVPCGFYPPVPPGEPLGECPWGMDDDKLWVFKESTFNTPGNFSPIAACGLGAVNYQACIEGQTATEFYAEGETVNVATQTGNLGIVTYFGLENRYAEEAAAGYYCDIESTPDPITGMDPDGKARAYATFVSGHSDIVDGIPYDYIPSCEYRLVLVPIIDHFPLGSSEDLLVLGVATFGIAGWDRTPIYGDDEGTTTQACGPPPPGPPSPPGTVYGCGMAWGYFIGGVKPPQALLNQSISDTDNPFAPLMIALVE